MDEIWLKGFLLAVDDDLVYPAVAMRLMKAPSEAKTMAPEFGQLHWLEPNPESKGQPPVRGMSSP